MLRTATSSTESPAALVTRWTTRPSEIRPGAPAGRVEKMIVFAGTSARGPQGAVIVRSSGRPETRGAVTEA